MSAMRTATLVRAALSAAAVVSMIARAPRPAHAQPSPDDAKRADALFTKGRDLLGKGDATAACPKFEESQRLDPGLGTLLNLALCHETVGRLGSALTEFREAAKLARATGESKREATAVEHIKALEPRAPMITFKVDEPAPGQTLAIAGVDVPATGWTVPVPVDPGTLTITVAAPERKPFETTVTLAERGQQTITVPALARLHALPVAIAPAPVSNTRRYLGIGLGGAGVVTVGVSVVVALGAKSKYDNAFSDGHCDKATSTCDMVGQNATDAARKRGTTATIIGAVGLAAIAGGVVLFLTAPHGEHATATAIVPTVGADGGGVAVLGSF
jgi:hypothetical protein